MITKQWKLPSPTWPTMGATTKDLLAVNLGPVYKRNQAGPPHIKGS